MTETRPTYTVNEVIALASAMVERARLAANLGKQFDGDRDLYEALGYPQTISFDDYLGRYKRQDIAKRIVDRPAKDTWRSQAKLMEGDQDKDTPFLAAWKTLVTKKGVWRHLADVDRMGGIGRFGVLLIGFTGTSKPVEPITQGSMSGAQDVLYLRPFAEGDVTIEAFDQNVSSARFGLPDIYQITLDDLGRRERVHWTRVIHVAEDSFDDVYGTPRLEMVYNRLNDLEKVVGGSAEATWKLMRKGFVLDVKPEYELSEADETAMLAQVEEMEHGLRRFLLTRGVTPSDLGSDVVDPKGLFEAIIALISGATGIPQRILLGSERGELASSQDEANWAAIMEARREQHAEPFILRPFIDRLVWAGVLPQPAAEYVVQWESLFALTDAEKAEIAKVLAEAMKILLDAGFSVKDALAFLGAVPHVVGFQPEAALRPAAQGNQPQSSQPQSNAKSAENAEGEGQPQRNAENAENAGDAERLNVQTLERVNVPTPVYERLTGDERKTAETVAREVQTAAILLADVLRREQDGGE